MAGQPKRREQEGRPPAPGARGYTNTHPPFEPGNTVAVKSGAWSERLIAETVEELRPDMQTLIDQAPWITALDRHALEDYLYDRARLVRFERWLTEHGDRDPEGKPRDRDLREVASLRRRCMDHRARLGFDPAARVRMNLDRVMAHDLALLWAQEDTADSEGGDGAG